MNSITQENPYKIKVTHDAKDFQKVFDSKNKTKEDTSAHNEGYRLNDKSGDDTKVNIKQAKASAGDKTDKNNSSEKANEKDLKDFSTEVRTKEDNADELSVDVILRETKEIEVDDIDVVSDVINLVLYTVFIFIRRLLHNVHDAFNNIINISEISFTITIVIDLNLITLYKLVCELEERHIWSSSRPIHCKETKAS